MSARAVAANVNPKLLYQRLVDPTLLEPEFNESIANYRCGSGTLRINVALSELPDFSCLPNVAGAAALYKSTHPSASPAAVKSALQAAGTTNWNSATDPDGTHERLLNVATF